MAFRLSMTGAAAVALIEGISRGALAARLVTLPVAMFGGLAEAADAIGDEWLLATLGRSPAMQGKEGQ